MTTTYLFLELNIKCGEYEFLHKIALETKCQNPLFAIYRRAASFYGKYNPTRTHVKGSQVWQYYYGEVEVEVWNYREITEQDYQLLRQFI